MTFLDVWVGYAILGVTAFSLVFVWAVRERQFSDFDRARRIPLEGGALPTPDDGSTHRFRADRWGLVTVAAVVGVLLITAVVLGWSSCHGTCR